MDLVWIVVAFLAGLSARALRLPPLVGYLAAGMALSAVDVTAGPLLERVGELGVALLLFIVGMDLRFRNLWRAEVLGAGGMHLLAFALLATAVGLLLGLPAPGAFLLGTGLGVSSLVMAAKMLDRQHSLGAYHGRVAIGILLLQTVLAAGLMAVLGGEPPRLWALGLVGLPLLRPVLQRLLTWIGHSELGLLFGLLLAAGGAFLFEWTGLSPELGALAAGALLAGHERTDDLSDALWGIKEVFLAGFFLQVGLVGLPGGVGLLVVVGLIAFLAVKTALYVGMLAAFRMTARTAFMTALPLTSYSGFTLIVAASAVEAGFVAEGALAVLALATAASYLLNAALGGVATPLWRRLAPVLTRLERDVRHPDAQPQTLGRTQFLVVGMGRAGAAAYDHLTAHLFCTAGLDVDPERIARHRRKHRRILYGDGRDAGLWEDLDLGRLEAVVLTVPGLETKRTIIEALRAGGFGGPITALTASRDEREALLEAGASAAYLSIEQAGQALAQHALTRRDPAPETVTLTVGADTAS